MPLTEFTLIRSADGLTLCFTARETRFGCLAYHCAEADKWIQWHPKWGWCSLGAEDEVTCLPLGLPKAQQRHSPPQGIWVRRDGATSHVFDLRWGGVVTAHAA